MALIWGARPHPDNAILVSAEADPARALRCDRTEPTTLQVIGRFFLRMVTSNKVGKEASADCYYHRTRPMSQLREAEPAELQRIVGGHVVMIAVDVAGLLDYVYSPVANLPVPGVFLHAMALDNLLVFGSDYKRYAELHFFNPALMFAVSVLAVLCLASAILDVYVPVWEKRLGQYQVEPGEQQTPCCCCSRFSAPWQRVFQRGDGMTCRRQRLAPQ
jgi:hypothetical protein